MSLIELLLVELDREAVTTRKMLERVPDEKFDWAPHPKSMNLKRLATHVAELPGWAAMAIETDELDFANNPYKPVEIKNTGELLKYFDDEYRKGRASLESADESKFNNTWTLRNGDQVYSKESKYDVIRMSFSQTIHHRAQLGVFLRLLEVPIPGSYGPSADETDFN